MLYTAKVTVQPKPEVNNPEGSVIASSLRKLGFSNVSAVFAGKYFEIGIEADSAEEARAQTERMCEKLLVHPLVENYTYAVVDG